MIKLDQETAVLNSFPPYFLLRRVKSYHSICQEHFDLRCFHDQETWMCLCTWKRHANCFPVDLNATYDYQGLNDCKNNGQCFSDTLSCPA